jgi:hypothetical protein
MNFTKIFIALPVALISFAMPSKSDISSFDFAVADSDGFTLVGVGYSQIKNNIMLGASFATDIEEAIDINALGLSAGYVFGDHEVGSFYTEVTYADTDLSDAEGGLAIGWLKATETGNSYSFSIDNDKIISFGIGFDIGMNREITFGVAESTDDDLDMDTIVSIGFTAYL